MIKNDDLVVLPRKEYEHLVARDKEVTSREKKVLQLSREVKQLKKNGKLPMLSSLKDLR